MTIDQQQYCISARNRLTGFTEAITGPMTKKETLDWLHTGGKFAKGDYKYFRSSKYPFRRHKK